MMLNIIVLFFCFFNLYLIVNVIDDGMSELVLWDHAIKQVESVKVMAERNCTSSFDFSFDTESFFSQVKKGELDNNTMHKFCGDTFAAINDLCKDSDYYKTMTSIKSVSCAFDKNIATPSTTLEAGHLQLTYNWGTSGHKKTVKGYLRKVL